MVMAAVMTTAMPMASRGWIKPWPASRASASANMGPLKQLNHNISHVDTAPGWEPVNSSGNKPAPRTRKAAVAMCRAWRTRASSGRAIIIMAAATREPAPQTT